MGQSDQALDRLNVLLHALPVENMPMTVSELDGYVTGILACSDMIAPEVVLDFRPVCSLVKMDQDFISGR